MASAALKQQDPPDEGTIIPGEGEGEGTEAQSGERDYDAEARERGWVPEAEFLAKPNADPKRWVDAKTFVERTDTMMPLLKADRDTWKRKFKELERTVKQATSHFDGAEKRAYDRAVADIEARVEAATEAGDVDAAKAALKEMKGLKPADSAPTFTKEEAIEAFDDFREENPWYDKANLASASDLEVSARLYADRMTEKHLDKTKTTPPAEFFAMIAELTAEKYPAIKAKTARAKPASAVEGSGAGRPQGRGKTWDNLPEGARRQYERFINKGIGIKSTGDKDKDVAAARAYYAKTHDWEGYKE